MGSETKIQWTDYTFNPWIGCSKVHTGCKNCYAEADMADRRKRVVWGPNGTRSKTSEQYWRQPITWNAKQQIVIDTMAEGREMGLPDPDRLPRRPRVFCASLADVFEDWRTETHVGIIVNHKGEQLCINDKDQNIKTYAEWAGVDDDRRPLTMDDLRRDLFTLIDATPNLDWLILTKRPENVFGMWPENVAAWEQFKASDPTQRHGAPKFRNNLWIGTSVSDQETADKAIPELLKLHELTPCLFLSVEPLVGPMELNRIKTAVGGMYRDPLGGRDFDTNGWSDSGGPCVDWVIAGGESGPNARPCKVGWLRELKNQCEDASVPFFCKQLGSNAEHDGGCNRKLFVKDKKGGDPAEWPESLRVRQFPKMAKASV